MGLWGPGWARAVMPAMAAIKTLEKYMVKCQGKWQGGCSVGDGGIVAVRGRYIYVNPRHNSDQLFR